ncbi:hypothetical protein RJ639_045454 [Escallonia herrerae]|uniref:Uncharacterized protein n=1 Tax=Escallonia herrerae TaxID=1293975 RepID=A0AA88W5X5_9ASTE|nr:hypothetical protein RJ639_045454 [Escallonia herrerae]
MWKVVLDSLKYSHVQHQWVKTGLLQQKQSILNQGFEWFMDPISMSRYINPENVNSSMMVDQNSASDQVVGQVDADYAGDFDANMPMTGYLRGGSAKSQGGDSSVSIAFAMRVKLYNEVACPAF